MTAHSIFSTQNFNFHLRMYLQVQMIEKFTNFQFNIYIIKLIKVVLILLKNGKVKESRYLTQLKIIGAPGPALRKRGEKG